MFDQLYQESCIKCELKVEKARNPEILGKVAFKP